VADGTALTLLETVSNECFLVSRTPTGDWTMAATRPCPLA